MHLVRLNPTSDMMKVNRHMDRFFNEFFSPMDRQVSKETFRWNPVADILENDDAFTIKVELPGLEKDQINLDVKENILTIKGERADDNEVKADKVYRRERFHGKFQRAFTLPSTVDADKIKAEFVDGLLKIIIPKVPKEKPKQITVH